MIYESFWYDYDGDFAFISSLLCLIFPFVVHLLHYVFFPFIFTNSSSLHVFLRDNSCYFFETYSLLPAARVFLFFVIIRPNDLFKQRGSGMGAPCPSLRLKIDSSIPLPTTLPTLLAAWSRGRESRVVWPKQAACIRDQVAVPSISLATIRFLFMFSGVMNRW